MKAYVIYIITDYAHPIAITTDKKEASKYLHKCENSDNYHMYSMDIVNVSDKITEFSNE